MPKSRGRASTQTDAISRRQRTASRVAPALPPGITRGALHKLWASARRRNAAAQSELYRLVVAHPEITGALRSFAAERDEQLRADAEARGLPAKKPKVLGAWEKVTAKAGRWIGIVSGGLPSLGKRR